MEDISSQRGMSLASISISHFARCYWRLVHWCSDINNSRLSWAREKEEYSVDFFLISSGVRSDGGRSFVQQMMDEREVVMPSLNVGASQSSATAHGSSQTNMNYIDCNKSNEL